MTLPVDLEPGLIIIGLRLLAVVGVLIGGRWLAKWARGGLVEPLQRFVVTESMVTLTTTLAYYSILVLSFALALAILGVPVSIILSVIALFLIILAIALQQSLASLAAAINFMLFKPFEVGHLIETCSIIGTVKEIQLFNTVILAGDNKTHILPNARIQSEGLTNYSKVGTIRADMAFGIGYASDLEVAKQILATLLAEDGRVLAEPPARIFVTSLGESSVDIAVWPFVDIADFYPFKQELPERVKVRFDAAGIEIPFPQRAIHVIRES